jgi:flagellar biosynthesis GTPase FlhF
VQASLIENQLARVWRLDGPTANTAGLVDLYGEILDVPVSRTPDGSQASDEEALFVDLPGVPVSDSSALDEIASRLATFREPQVHLVLNAAYETPLLLAQVGFFSAIAVTDLIVTHLDEESRWAKLWNLVLGTNYTLRFLSAGQNIPGEFTPATAEALLARIFPSKAALDRVRTV